MEYPTLYLFENVYLDITGNLKKIFYNFDNFKDTAFYKLVNNTSLKKNKKINYIKESLNKKEIYLEKCANEYMIENNFEFFVSLSLSNSDVLVGVDHTVRSLVKMANDYIHKEKNPELALSVLEDAIKLLSNEVYDQDYYNFLLLLKKRYTTEFELQMEKKILFYY